MYTWKMQQSFWEKAVQHCFWYMVGELQENHLKSASVFHKGWCMLGVLWLPAIRQRAVFAPCTQLDKVTERICDLSLFQALENCATASPLQQPNSYHPYQFYIPFTDFDRVSAVRVWNLIMRCCRLVAVHRTERCHPLDLLEAKPQQLPASGRHALTAKAGGLMSRSHHRHLIRQTLDLHLTLARLWLNFPIWQSRNVKKSKQISKSQKHQLCSYKYE